MTRQQHLKHLKNIFIGYSGSKKYELISSMFQNSKHSVPERYLRKCVNSMLLEDSSSCLFEQKFNTLLITADICDDDIMSFQDAVAFMYEYGKNNLKSTEFLGTAMDYCDDVHTRTYPHHVYILSKIFANGGIASGNINNMTLGTYFSIKEYNEYLHFSKFENRKGYIEKAYNIKSRVSVDFLSGIINLYMDDILLNLYAMQVPYTKETLMMAIDFSLGHERKHRSLDCKNGQRRYFDKHWRNIYNESGKDVLEQECNRSGLIYAVKQHHKRLRERCVCGNQKYRKSKLKGTANV